MADYFTNFSFVVALPDKAAQQHALALATAGAAGCEGEPLLPGFPPKLVRFIDDWVFEADAESGPDKTGLWLHSSRGGIEAVCAFVQHLLKRFAAPDAVVAFEWSHDCTKPRIDAFGGGAAVVTAAKIKSMSTVDWLHQQASRRTRNHKQKGETTK